MTAETTSTKIRLPVHHTQEMCDAAPEVFEIELDRETANILLARVALVKRLKGANRDLQELVYDCGIGGEWYGRDWEADGDEENLDAAELLVEPTRTEYDRLHVGEHGVRWTADLKHTDVELATEDLSVEGLERIAGARRCGDCREVIAEPSHPEIPGQWDEPVQGPDGWYHRACRSVFP